MKAMKNLSKGISTRQRVILIAVSVILVGGGAYVLKSATNSADTSRTFSEGLAVGNLSGARDAKAALPGQQISDQNQSDILQQTFKEIADQKLSDAKQSGDSYMDPLQFAKQSDLEKFANWADQSNANGQPVSFEDCLEWMAPTNPKDYHAFMAWMLKTDPDKFKSPTFEHYFNWLKTERPQVHTGYSEWLLANKLTVAFDSYLKWLSAVFARSQYEDLQSFLTWATRDGRQATYEDYAQWLEVAKPEANQAYQQWLAKNGLEDTYQNHLRWLEQTQPETVAAYRKWLADNGLADNFDNFLAFQKAINDREHGRTTGDYARWLEQNNLEPSHEAYIRWMEKTNPSAAEAYQQWLESKGLEDNFDNYLQYLEQTDPTRAQRFRRWAAANGLEPSAEAFQAWLSSEEAAIDKALHETGIALLDPDYQAWLKRNGLEDSFENHLEYIKETTPALYAEFAQWAKDHGLPMSEEAFEAWKATLSPEKLAALPTRFFDPGVLGARRYLSDMHNQGLAVTAKTFTHWLNLNNSPILAEIERHAFNTNQIISADSIVEWIESSHPQTHKRFADWADLQCAAGSFPVFLGWESGLPSHPTISSPVFAYLDDAFASGAKISQVHYTNWLNIHDYPSYEALKRSSGQTDIDLEAIKEGLGIADENGYTAFIIGRNFPDDINGVLAWAAYNTPTGACHPALLGERTKRADLYQAISNGEVDASYEAIREWIRRFDPATESAYQQWLTDNNLADTPENLAKFLASQDDDLSAYEQWLKQRGLVDSPQARLLWEGQKMGIDPSSAGMRELAKEAYRITDEARRQSAGTEHAPLPDELQAALDALPPEARAAYERYLVENGLAPSMATLQAWKDSLSPFSRSLLESGGSIHHEGVDYKRLNRELEYKRMIGPAVMIDDILAASTARSVRVMEAAMAVQDKPVSGSGYAATGLSLQDVDGASRYEVFERDRSIDRGSIPAIQRARQQSASPNEPASGGGTPRTYPSDRPLDDGSGAAFTILPGQEFFASLSIGVNTDEISPTKAVVHEGPLKGAELLGVPMPIDGHAKSVVISFSKMSFNGKSYTIDAIATDPNTRRSRLADRVDRHVFERYFSLGVSAFAGAYAESMIGMRESSTGGDNKEWITDPLSTAGDRSVYAGGKMLEKFVPFFEQNFNRKATVEVYNNRPIGVMFMSELAIEEQ
ncbi:DotG/IcmE/VirB10 family protein [Ferrimonas marina]|uniref:Conjugation TrbI-like protein n=1 Tax=Ferrimonas marina TaxID=299255 RepID=A0A1M5TL00_9GAMM|nr:DotG/IcmE/VirB10 family protein [Ferrimonas marina]SHH51043.1 conjugation TrbI-like protein [Ferrimonas marina]